jgi:hypothetical protein
MKDVILTYDYELFLGTRSGTIDNCLIRPVNEINKILQEHNALCEYFIDSTYLLFLKNNKPSDFEIISKHIIKIIQSGNRVQFHVHPHWLYGTKNSPSSSEWILDSTFFSLDDLPMSSAKKIWLDSYNLLSDIVLKSKVGSDFKINTYRAGGWRIPNATLMEQMFSQTEISIDSSVCCEGSPSNIQTYWKFDNNPLIKHDQGKFLEVPVTCFSNNIFNRVANKVLINKEPIFGDGVGVKKHANYNKMLNFIRTDTRYLSLDFSHPIFFQSAVRKIVDNMANNDGPIVIASHPKVTTKYSLENLTYIVKNFNTVPFESLL